MLLLGDRAEDVAAWVSSKLAPPLRGAPRRTAVCTGEELRHLMRAPRGSQTTHTADRAVRD